VTRVRRSGRVRDDYQSGKVLAGAGRCDVCRRRPPRALRLLGYETMLHMRAVRRGA
jgi:hypothetical protein